LFAAATAIAGTGCRADPADDLFARTFIDRLIARDSAGFAQLQPESSIDRGGWQPLLTGVAAHLPPTQPDSVRLIEWERGNDDQGPYRKLIYEVSHGSKHSRVELWLVTTNALTYVNTIRIPFATPNP